MKKLFTMILLICLLSCSSLADTAYDESMVPASIDEDLLIISSKTVIYERKLTGIRFDIDDENMPVVIIKQKVKNISNRSQNCDSSLWVFAYSPYASGGSALEGAGKHYQKEYLGVTIEKNKKGKTRIKRNFKSELAPDEEYEWESVYRIENFSKPIYMYFITEKNSINFKWRKETLVVIPDKGTAELLEK